MLCFRPARRPIAAPLAMLLALGVTPMARAQPAPADATEPSDAPDAEAAAPADDQVVSDPSADPPSEPEAAEKDGSDDDVPEPEAAESDEGDFDDDDGDLDDDSDLDDDAYDGDLDDDTPRVMNLPDRLEPLPRWGWWSLFGAFTLGTTAGVLAGLAERQEDKALRLTLQLDVERGEAPLYADERDNYEQILRRGERLQTGAIIVGAFAGAAAVAGITLFVLDAKRGRSSETARRTRLRSNGIEVRF